MVQLPGIDTTTTHGVPLDSVLGPVLFLLNINDVTQVVDQSIVHLYTDDTVLYLSGKDSMIVQSQLQRYLNKFSLWCMMNKLTLNIKKTKSITFFQKHKHGPECNFNVDGQWLEVVTSGLPRLCSGQLSK